MELRVRAPAKRFVLEAYREEKPVEDAYVKVCLPVHVFGLARLREATTAPVVGLIVSVPSAFVTDDTAPLPEPQAVPVPVICPFGAICAHCVPALPSPETKRLVVEAVPETVSAVVEEYEEKRLVEDA